MKEVSMEGVFVEKWGVYGYEDGRWTCKLHDKAPKNVDPTWTRRIRIPVPAELAMPVIEAKVAGIHAPQVESAAPPPAAPGQE